MFAGGGGGRRGGGIEESDKLDRSQTRVVLARCLRMAGEFRRPALWAFLLVIVTTACTLAGPVLVRHGIDAETGKKLHKAIKDSKLKVTAALMGDKLRVTGKSRDELQAAMRLLKQSATDRPIGFNNFRD